MTDETRLRAAFAMAPDFPEMFFAHHLARLAELVDLEPVVLTDLRGAPDATLAGLDILITGWRAPLVDVEALDRMPRLRAVIHSAGSVKSHVDPEVWRRGIVVSSAGHVNAIPVAEYSLAMILLALKRALPIAARYRAEERMVDVTRDYRQIGANGARVGLIGASAIGRLLLDLLRPHDLDVLVYDPYVDAVALAGLGARKASLEEVMDCPVVSIHAPSTPETAHMVGARELALMPDDATLINTARGALLDHDALHAELVTGRLFAVLDVTEPEPLPPGHPFYRLPNVLLTPHLAGSHGNELLRLGGAAVDEVQRVVNGEPLGHPVAAGALQTIA